MYVCIYKDYPIVIYAISINRNCNVRTVTPSAASMDHLVRPLASQDLFILPNGFFFLVILSLV